MTRRVARDHVLRERTDLFGLLIRLPICTLERCPPLELSGAKSLINGIALAAAREQRLEGTKRMLIGSLSKVCAGQLKRLRRLDKVAADLNVLLAVFAIGLAALDMTVAVSQQVVDRLPEVTRVVLVDAPAPASGAAIQPADAP